MHYQDKRLAHARDILAGVEQRLGVSASGFRQDLNQRVMREGEVYCADGSIGQVIVALMAGMAEDGWCAVVGLPEIGWASAVERGFPLERAVVVPDVHGKLEAVLHYLIPYMEVVSVRNAHLTRGQQQKVAARLRRYRTVLVTMQPWPGISRALPPGLGALPQDVVSIDEASVAGRELFLPLAVNAH